MSKKITGSLGAAIASLLLAPAVSAEATSITEALTSGKAYGDFRLRYESVEQDNPADDASALTLRSRLGYTTGSFNGFSSTIEMEDSRVVAGQDDYDLPPPAQDLGYVAGGYSVIADPETTELDQFFIQYKNDVLTTKLGRQVITLDDHRFVGHVGWRQDRQTFDALSLNYSPTSELAIYYAYLDQRNRIFGEVSDVNSKDHLFNVSYKTPVGKVVGYAYLLEEDNDTDNAIDTFGVSFSGATKSDVKFLYNVEIAQQSAKSGAADFDADYMNIELGVALSGITVKAGYELLGSDEGAYVFQTPLATLHKFNGWADAFLLPNLYPGGLEDIYLSVGGKVLGGKWAVAYHQYSADEGSLDDYGDELNLLFAKKFGKNYNAGIKYAAYSADDFSVDTDKLWLWVGASF